MLIAKETMESGKTKDDADSMPYYYCFMPQSLYLLVVKNFQLEIMKASFGFNLKLDPPATGKLYRRQNNPSL